MIFASDYFEEGKPVFLKISDFFKDARNTSFRIIIYDFVTLMQARSPFACVQLEERLKQENSQRILSFSISFQDFVHLSCSKWEGLY